KTLAMVLRYTHVHGTHVDQAISAIGRAIPEPNANRTRDTTTQKLHESLAPSLRLISGDDKKE
ncbi:MAG: hypothetical protein WAM72_14145, partial [Xanthobacteraceae bacterium]